MRTRFILGIPALVLVSACGPLSAQTVARPQHADSQSSVKATKPAVYIWCWAAGLRPSPEGRTHVFYSDIFTSNANTTAMDAAFGVFVQKTYLRDFKATGTGPGQCHTYDSVGAAQAALDIYRADQKDHNNLIFSTIWTYGATVWDCGFTKEAIDYIENVVNDGFGYLIMNFHPDFVVISNGDFTSRQEFKRQPDGMILLEFGGPDDLENNSLYLHVTPGGAPSGYEIRKMNLNYKYTTKDALESRQALYAGHKLGYSCEPLVYPGEPDAGDDAYPPDHHPPN